MPKFKKNTSPFMMKGFSGFGNSPLKQNKPINLEGLEVNLEGQKKFGPITIGGKRKVPRFSLIEKAHEKGLGALVEAQDWTELQAAAKIIWGKLKKRFGKKNK